jgi:hypothetical protein
MNEALSGAILLGHWAIGVFFFRFSRKRGERLFTFFAFAFWLLALERFFLLLMEPRQESQAYVYLVRLIAFLLILYAIYDKNRSASPPATTREQPGEDQGGQRS